MLFQTDAAGHSVVLPACVVPIIIYGRKVRKSARAMQGHLAELSTLIHESFTGNRIIKAYNLEDAVSGEFRQITGKFIGHVMRVIRSNELPSQLTEFLAGIGVAMVFGYGVIFYHVETQCRADHRRLRGVRHGLRAHVSIDQIADAHSQSIAPGPGRQPARVRIARHRKRRSSIRPIPFR